MNAAADSIIPPPPPSIKGNFEIASIYRSKAGLAFLVFMTTLFISIGMEPAFLLVTPADPFQERRICYPRAFAVSLISSFVFIRLPVWCRDS
jgi:hypothetical protein